MKILSSLPANATKHRWLWSLTIAAVLAAAGLVWLHRYYSEDNTPPFGGQEGPNGTKPAANRWQALLALDLPSFGKSFTVYHSMGHEKRARELAGLIEPALRFYEDKLKIRAEFTLAVLTRADWELVEKRTPYGLPSVSPPPHVVLLPATRDGILVKEVLDLRGRAAPATLRKIEQAGFTFEQGAEHLTDLIGLHELGHVLTRAYGIGPPSRWSNEFLATYFAYAYLSAKQPRLALLFDAMTYDLQCVDGVKPKHTSLEDFDRHYSGVGAANYGWYQSMLHGRVRQVHESKKLAFLEEVRAVYPFETREGESARVVLERWERICPGFVAWGEKLREW